MENKEIINLYLRSAKHELEGAQHNLDGGYFGIAVSRAYYAFLYASSALLLTEDIIRSKHSAVLSAFRENFVKPGKIEKRYSDAFGEAFEVRQISDYDLAASIEIEQASKILSYAKAFVKRIIDYLEESGGR